MDKPPTIPKTLVELGRAVEIETTTRRWRWSKKDNWVVCASTGGKRLFVFQKPKKKSTQKEGSSIRRGQRLYDVFSGRPSEQIVQGKVPELRYKGEDRAVHIIYHSDKFGSPAKYIHEFDTPPIVWTSSQTNPKMIALTGGKITITDRGIEG